jgi:DNA helicase-2/ATP-dependent DNA helicase PcrA
MHQAMAWVGGGGRGGVEAATHEGFDRFLDALQLSAWVAEVFVERQRQADALAYFDGLRQAARVFSSPKAFFDSLGALELQRSASASPMGAARAGRGGPTKSKARAGDEVLTLATIAAVKGLEFDQVAIPYLRQGVFPWHLASSERDERNLFYVGITRARRELVLMADQVAPSGFVAGLMGLQPGQAGVPDLAP